MRRHDVAIDVDTTLFWRHLPDGINRPVGHCLAMPTTGSYLRYIYMRPGLAYHVAIQ